MGKATVRIAQIGNSSNVQIGNFQKEESVHSNNILLLIDHGQAQDCFNGQMVKCRGCYPMILQL